MTDFAAPDRRDLLAAPLLAMASALLGTAPARAAGVDPSMTIVVPPAQIPWQPLSNFPAGMAEQAPMVGKIGDPGQYLVLIRWHQGYMSAPHFYETDRLCVVLSGTWRAARISRPRRRCRSGRAPSCGAWPAGRPYDGVIKSAPEPCIIAIAGMGPIHDHLTDPSKPGWREV